MIDDFKEFWQRYPHKIGKLAAEKAYRRARQKGVTQAELLAGITRYVATKPVYADYCHPTTWLNQGRWLDEPDHAPSSSSDWFDECERLHAGNCGGSFNHSTRMLIDAEKRKHRV